MEPSNAELIELLNNNPIEGVDYKDGLARFGGQAKIYKRIIKAFISNTPNSLDLLLACMPDHDDDYIIRVHGLKGSCYGISAMRHGDLAKSLEFAAKGGDWDLVAKDTPNLIDEVNDLIKDLQGLVEVLEGEAKAIEDTREVVDIPNKEIVLRLKAAATSFDLDEINLAIDALDEQRYSFDSHLVGELRTNLMNFRYDLIDDKANELLDMTL